MTRLIEFKGEEINKLVSEEILYLGLASRTLYIFPKENNPKEKEIIMNYEGEGYRPVKVTIEFEYDEDIKFSEDED